MKKAVGSGCGMIGAVGMTELVGIVGAIGHLTIHLNDVSKIMINKTEKLDKFEKTAVIVTEMMVQKATADELRKAVLSTLPSWTTEDTKPVP
ncbi:hypothetical protein Vi05172_g9922 [Venturia inaequalis]|nr:hypothetical protein Vi05172_g9922 [Venturia inaequalis]